MTKIKYKLSSGNEIEIEVTDRQAEVLIEIERHDASARRKDRRHNVESLDKLKNPEDGSVGWEPMDEYQDICGDIEDHEDTERLESAISCLNARQQELVRLYYYEEKNFTEIAAILGIDRRNVSRQLDTIHKKLRKIF